VLVLLAATAAHAGFQLTVTTVVYPALFGAPDWGSAHAVHRRAITPVVTVVYVGLLTASVLVLLDGVHGPGVVVALAGTALSVGTTALFAAPLHGRLSRGRDAALVRQLQAADLVRTVGAFVALSGAGLAAL